MIFKGATAVSGVGIIKVDWKLYKEGVLASFSILQGLFLMLASKTLNVFIMYGCYVAFGVIYHTAVTVARSDRNIPTHFFCKQQFIIFLKKF